MSVNEKAQQALEALRGSPSDQEQKQSQEKMYHHINPGSTFYAKDLTCHSFNPKGELKTSDPELIKELDAIADKPGSPVYTKSAPTPAPASGNPVEEIKNQAAQAVKELEAQRQRLG